MFLVQTLIDTVGDHSGPKFCSISIFAGKQTVDGLNKYLDPSDKMTRFHSNLGVQRLVDDQWVSKIDRSPEDRFFPEITHHGSVCRQIHRRKMVSDDGIAHCDRVEMIHQSFNILPRIDVAGRHSVETASSPESAA